MLNFELNAHFSVIMAFLTLNFFSHIFVQHLTSILVILTHSYGIRVDFNTNTGPIIPPTTTQRPVPQPPFREPAPVWEDQSDDVPNPNPYRYECVYTIL